MLDLARTMPVAMLLGAAACAPAPTPGNNHDGAAVSSVVAIPAPVASEPVSASVDVAVPSPSTADKAIAGVAASAMPALGAAVASALAPEAGAGFRCFSWAHERDFSTDCYRTRAQCLVELQHMKDGARLPTECEPREHASCTTLKGGEERCFGDAANCGRYRAFVGRNHLETTECVPR